MGLFFWLIFPGAVLLVLECLIVALTHTQKGCFVVPVLAAVGFFFTVCVTTAATGWNDTLSWGFLSMSAGTGLLGSLLGLGIGRLFRRIGHSKTEG